MKKVKIMIIIRLIINNKLKSFQKIIQEINFYNNSKKLSKDKI